MLRFENTIYLSLLFKFVWSSRLTWILTRSEVLLFLESVTIVFSVILIWLYYHTHFCNLCHLIQLIDYLKLSNFLTVLPAFNCASAIGNLGSICSGASVLIPFPWFNILHFIFDENDIESSSKFSFKRSGSVCF